MRVPFVLLLVLCVLGVWHLQHYGKTRYRAVQRDCLDMERKISECRTAMASVHKARHRRAALRREVELLRQEVSQLK